MSNKPDVFKYQTIKREISIGRQCMEYAIPIDVGKILYYMVYIKQIVIDNTNIIIIKNGKNITQTTIKEIVNLFCDETDNVIIQKSSNDKIFLIITNFNALLEVEN